MKNVTFKIQRYDPEEGSSPHFQEFTVPLSPSLTVLNGLQYIKANLDGSLSFRASCRMAICGSCGVMVNDYPYLACHSQVEEFHSSRLTIRPLPNFPLIKDLVTDMTDFFRKHESVKPYIIRRDSGELEKPTSEFAQTPEEGNAYLQFSCCVKCGICVSACPTCGSDSLFLGPQALSQCYRYCADSRDEGETERLPLVNAEQGVWHCHLANACAESCPKGVDPALAIQLLKRRLAYRALRLGQRQPPAAPVTPLNTRKLAISFPEFNIKPEEKK